MEWLDDKYEGDPVKVMGSRSFLFNFPGSVASVGWQAVEKFKSCETGHFWLSDGEETLNINLNAGTAQDRDITVGALTNLINMAREARNYLKSIDQFNEPSS